MIAKYLLVWFVLVAVAIINGIIRNEVYKDSLGDLRAHQLSTLTGIILFGLVIIFSIIANILVYYSVKGEKVSNLEPAKVLDPLFVIILAIVFSFFFSGIRKPFWLSRIVVQLKLQPKHIVI